MNPKFSKFCQVDLANALSIEKKVQLHPWSETIFNDCFKPSYHNIQITIEGEMVGYAVCNYVVEECHLLNISIAEAFQGKGLGTALLEEVLRIAESAGQTEVWLEVRISNRAAIKLYEKLGFVEQGVRPNYYPSEKGREDALVMVLFIG